MLDLEEKTINMPPQWKYITSLDLHNENTKKFLTEIHCHKIF